MCISFAVIYSLKIIVTKQITYVEKPYTRSEIYIANSSSTRSQADNYSSHVELFIRLHLRCFLLRSRFSNIERYVGLPNLSWNWSWCYYEKAEIFMAGNDYLTQTTTHLTWLQGTRGDSIEPVRLWCGLRISFDVCLVSRTIETILNQLLLILKTFPLAKKRYEPSFLFWMFRVLNSI